MEMKALRLQNKALKAENARLKATRAAIYKLYLESEGNAKGGIFSRAKVFEALQFSADEEEPAPRKMAAQKPTIHWKAEWDEKAKQRVLHADGTPKTKAQYGGLQTVYRVVKEEVEAAGDVFVSDRYFRTKAEQILKVAQDAEANSDCIVAVEVVTVTLRILRIQTCYRLFSYVGAEFENGVNLRKVCERFCILQIIKKT